MSVTAHLICADREGYYLNVPAGDDLRFCGHRAGTVVVLTVKSSLRTKLHLLGHDTRDDTQLTELQYYFRWLGRQYPCSGQERTKAEYRPTWAGGALVFVLPQLVEQIRHLLTDHQLELDCSHVMVSVELLSLVLRVFRQPELLASVRGVYLSSSSHHDITEDVVGPLPPVRGGHFTAYALPLATWIGCATLLRLPSLRHEEVRLLSTATSDPLETILSLRPTYDKLRREVAAHDLEHRIILLGMPSVSAEQNILKTILAVYPCKTRVHLIVAHNSILRVLDTALGLLDDHLSTTARTRHYLSSRANKVIDQFSLSSDANDLTIPRVPLAPFRFGASSRAELYPHLEDYLDTTVTRERARGRVNSVCPRSLTWSGFYTGPSGHAALSADWQVSFGPNQFNDVLQRIFGTSNGSKPGMPLDWMGMWRRLTAQSPHLVLKPTQNGSSVFCTACTEWADFRHLISLNCLWRHFIKGTVPHPHLWQLLHAVAQNGMDSRLAFWRSHSYLLLLLLRLGVDLSPYTVHHDLEGRFECCSPWCLYARTFQHGGHCCFRCQCSFHANELLGHHPLRPHEPWPSIHDDCCPRT